LSVDDEVGHHSTFMKNRGRSLGNDVVRQFLARLFGQEERVDLLLMERFSAGGTIVEVVESMNMYRPKDETCAAYNLVWESTVVMAA
jgi:hypothetical protein